MENSTITETKEPKEHNYTNKISIEEYTKQKDDFTQKALKELTEQMKTFTKPKERKEKDNDDNNDNNNDDDGNDGSESDYDTNLDTTNKCNSKKTHPSINLIVQHVENKQKKRKLMTTKFQDNTTITMSDSIYAQHEVDMQTIQLLKDKINDLKIENADLDSKKHYLTLDLNNAQCDINNLNKQVSYLKDQLIIHKQFIKQMKKYDDDFGKMLKLFAIGMTILILYYIKFLVF